MNKEVIHPPLFDADGKSVMARISPDKIARYVILSVHDPLGYERDVAEEIADYLEEAKLIADTHMFVTYTGKYRGVPITVCSTGSGAPETEIALVEFFRFSNADTFIRAGTSGTYLDEIEVGDIVIAEGAVRDEGTSADYVKPTYPAIASYEVTLAMAEAAERLGFRYHIGITRSTDSCQVGQGRPVLGYIQEEHRQIPDYWKKVGIKNFERETSIVYIMCSLFNRRGGAVNAVVNSTPKGNLNVGAGSDETFRTILEGITILAEWDKTKQKLNKKYWLPSMQTLK